MPSPILARADALMRRRREQSAEGEDIPVLIDAVDDDDVPVLLDAEAAIPAEISATEPSGPESPAEPPAAAEAPGEAPPQPVFELPEIMIPPPPTRLAPAPREDVAREVARRVEQRLAAELPKIVEAAVRDYLDETDGGHPAPGG